MRVGDGSEWHRPSCLSTPSKLERLCPLQCRSDEHSYNQADSDCLGTENGYFGCVHGGEKIKIVASGISSCKGLSIQDSLGVFNWTCDGSKNPVIFYTRTFNSGKDLKNLINPANLQFLPLGAVVTDQNSCTVLNAPASAQWFNPILDLFATSSNPAANLTLSPAGSIGTIYL